MSDNLNNNDDAIKYFTTFFTNLKEEINKRFCDKDNDQLSYRDLAFKDAINSLPCPVEIARLRVDRAKYSDAKSDVYYLIKYNFSDFGNFSINHHGEYELGDFQNHSELVKSFDLDEQRIEDVKTLKLIYYEDVENWLWYWLVPQNTLTDHEGYIRDFLLYFEYTFKDNIQKIFGGEIDYLTKYDLQKDPILSPTDLLQIDKTVSYIYQVRTDKESKQILEVLQREVYNIQLSPKVPENVKEIFNKAKKLYIFGYFDYFFFTISDHYAFLSCESALRNKYTELFGTTKEFVKLHKIIDKLCKEKVIREAEKPFYDLTKEMRNELSHITQPYLSIPRPGTLEHTAFLINQIYEDYKYETKKGVKSTKRNSV